MAADLVRRIASEWNLPATKSRRGGRRKGQRGGPWGASGAEVGKDPWQYFAAMILCRARDDWKYGNSANREAAREFMLSPECGALCDFVDTFTHETLLRLLGVREG